MVDFLLSAYRLKDEDRTGWRLRRIEAPESVADHSWGTAFLCLLFAEEAGVDSALTVQMALVHDLAEALTGDVASRADPADRSVSSELKAQLERSAMRDLLAGVDAPDAEALLSSLWDDYETRLSAESEFVCDMNLIDMCLQALYYERERRYDPRTPLPSSRGYTHLDEFFVSAGGRLVTEVGKRLYHDVRLAYLEAREKR